MKYFEVFFTISAPEEQLQDVRDVLAATTAEAGFETFEEVDGGMKGYVQRDAFDAVALDAAVRALPFPAISVRYDVRDADDRDWNEQWEQEGFDPISVGEHLIISDGRHLPHPSLTEGRTVVVIDARMAFGTGNHETTRMMAEQLMGSDLQGRTVLDCGTGTGVLAIVALLNGAREAVGYDIDEWSVSNARHNAVINHVDKRFTPLLGDSDVIGQTGKTFDMILANINRNILLADMPRMRSVMKPGARMMLSGFYTTDSALLEDKARQLGLTLLETHSDGGWACLVFGN